MKKIFKPEQVGELLVWDRAVRADEPDVGAPADLGLDRGLRVGDPRLDRDRFGLRLLLLLDGGECCTVRRDAKALTKTTLCAAIPRKARR